MGKKIFFFNASNAKFLLNKKLTKQTNEQTNG